MNDNAAKKPFSIQKTVLRILLYFVVIDVCIITLYPYFAMFCTALKSRAEIFSPHGTILPVTALWSNFIDIWSRAPMANYLLNSILIAGGSTIIAMLIGIYQVMQALHLTDSILGLIFINAAFNQAFTIWLLRGTFMGISAEMEQAATIDGCNRLQSMTRVLLPVAAPGIVTTLIFIFINAWNEYTVALCLISTDEFKPLTVGINIFNGYNMIEWQYLFAASIFAIIPVVILFMCIEKNLVSGLASGGVKG